MVFELEKDASDDFEKIKINLRGLPRFETYRNSGRPFSATLSEVLKAKIAQNGQ